MERLHFFGWTVVCLQFLITLTKCNFDPFMDTDLFAIKWAGPLDLNTEEVESLGDRHVLITTNHQEQYRCIMPEILKKKEDDVSKYTGPPPEELLKPLFKASYCSYRIETYWTYELCHGKHLKQYHEVKEQGAPPKAQEYYLGFGNHREKKKDGTESKEEESDDLPVRELDGISLPYFEVIMGDGTTCDLTGQPRKAHILYVCQPEGRGEVYELKESSTCEYEVLVLTAHLCAHPAYRPKTEPVTEIRCHAMYGSPLKPSELYQAEHESRYLQQAAQDYLQQQVAQANTAPVRQVNPPASEPKTDDDDDDDDDDDVDTENSESPTTAKPPTPKKWPEQPKLGAITDKQTLRDFLTGSQCLSGGTGWWKHEVCFGKFAKQYHIERGSEISIYLGYWDKEKHLQWLRDNPTKRPKPLESRKYVSLYYTNGDTCDLTGQHRTCEVRIKCLENMKNSHAVILSLSEPSTCQYVLTVESALFCPAVKEADANGLFDHIKL